MSERAQTKLSPDLLAATSALADNLAHALPIVAYRRAQAHLAADREAADLLEQYNQGVAAWRFHQAHGEVTPGEVEGLQKLQSAVRSNATIAEVAEAQTAAQVFLREINAEIGQLIGIDFGALARRESCC